ncbi:MAG: phosphoribosyltransferase family protein [Methanothrix sp.]|nr:phosphoribosyltransferase family protein [Methanothrix sp.]
MDGISAAETLGECMAFLINNSYGYLKSFDLMVAVPPSTDSRGYNQAALLAQDISKRISIPFYDALYKKRPSPPQHKTAYKEKDGNVKDIYECKEDLSNLKIILIDDICTTKSTLNNCALALKRCGAKEIRGFVAGRSTDVRNVKYIKQEEKYDIYQGRSQNG